MSPDGTRRQTPDGRPTEEQPEWRSQFPIDWPEDHYIARRDFTRFLVLTSLAFVVGQGWIAAHSLLPESEVSLELELAGVDDLAIGESRLFHYPTPEEPCILVRAAEDRFLAFSQKCTHLSCGVIPQVERKRFFCPCHEGVFDMDSGRPLAGPPRRPLPRVRLQVRNRRVYATGWEPSS